MMLKLALFPSGLSMFALKSCKIIADNDVSDTASCPRLCILHASR
jgi:hypothetical protein